MKNNFLKRKNMDKKIAIIGLGYVGLPLAVEFGKFRETIGYDINHNRIKQLKSGTDVTLETTSKELSSSPHLSFTDNINDISTCQYFIVTVPTPIDSHKTPDLNPLKKASKAIAPFLKKGAIVIYESTVYPGATEEICVPILEKYSGLKFNSDFYCGYSPERINPGDKTYRLTNIKKITSGSTPQISIEVDNLYKQVITAGTHLAPSIKVAEAAKVIENTQRDVNIALINELSKIFKKLDIDTEAVLEAARTKWNFLDFRPGLVGGHCIGVDPYYLTYKAIEVGYHPDIILAGRRTNDNMGAFIADDVTKLMTKKSINVSNSKILIMGITFKENCPDIRNTKVIDIITELKTYNANVDIFDPWADPEELSKEYGIELTTNLKKKHYDAIILAVGHEKFREIEPFKLREYCKIKHVLYDVKHLYHMKDVDGRL